MRRSRRFLPVFFLLLGFLSGPAQASELSLTEAVELALQRNSRIYQSDKELELSRLNIIKALGIALPKVSARYDFSHLRYRYEQESNVTVAGQTITTPLPRSFDSNKASLNVVQPLFSGGRDWILFFGAFDTIRLNEALLERTRQEVVFDTKQAYYQVLNLSRLVEVANQAVAQMEEHYHVATAHFEQGMAVKTDVLSAEITLASARQQLIKAKNSEKLARSMLNFLIDKELERFFELIEDDSATSPLKVDSAGCVELALQFRPEIRQMRSKLALDNKQVWLARSDYFPSMGLFYTHQLEGGLMVKDDPNYWEDTSEEESWIAGGYFELKLFNGGMTAANVREEKIKLNQSKRRFSDLMKKIRLEVLTAYSAVEENLALLDVSQKTGQQAQENFRITKLLYAEGLAQSSQVMDAHTLLANAQTEELQANYNYKLALSELEKAVGRELEEGEFQE